MALANSNILYKYESMQEKWCRCLEGENPRAARLIENFFEYFYKHHRRCTFVVGELFDGSVHLLLQPDQYRQVKKEIEQRIDGTLPEVAQIRDATVIRKRQAFKNFTSFKDFCKSLIDENMETTRRKKEGAKESAKKLHRTIESNPQALFLAFDLEVYEHDHSIILEIGYAMTTLDKPEEDMQTCHYIIKENLEYVNGDYVPDNRDRFKFGTSRLLSLRMAALKIQKHIQEADFLVTHSGSNDKEFLASCGVSVSGKYMFDTQILAMALLPDGPTMYSLKRLLIDLKIPFDEKILHNGGNDAYYTMDAFLALKDLQWRNS